MPAVQAPATVLVTGASGFLAAHVARELLEQGFSVKGTVRSNDKGDYLKQQFENFGDKFSYVIVEDIEKEDAFDDAVKGVDAIEHTASPFHMRADDPAELINPAVKGTVGILKSAGKNGGSVKRIVVTSSVAAITETTKPQGYVFTEADWNQESLDVVEKKGKEAPQGFKYRASKTLAERAAWDFIKENEGKIPFDLAVINPPFIFGPTIHQVASVDKLNTSVAQFYDALKKPSKEAAVAYPGNYVDVRDVAKAHAAALTVEEAAGNRFIVSNGPFTWNDVYKHLAQARVANVPEPFAEENDKSGYFPQSGAKAAKVLGIKYTDDTKTMVDTIESIRARFPETA